MTSLRVVIVSSGRVGERTIPPSQQSCHDVVVIQTDSDVEAALSDEYIATVIEGGATQPSILS